MLAAEFSGTLLGFDDFVSEFVSRWQYVVNITS